MGDDAGISRRTVLKGIGAAGLTAGIPALTSSRARAATAAIDWTSFDAAARRAFHTMGGVGAAYAVVSADKVLHAHTLGVRDLASRKPVDAHTHFMVASTTKSMTSLLTATQVDAKRLHWDDKVTHVWSAFRAPTDELTHSLRVRDLYSMATGIGEPGALSAVHQGDPNAQELLLSMATLPLLERDTFFYNNTVYAVGGYVTAIRDGVRPDNLSAGYAKLMHDHVYRPTGMQARLIDDPRGFVTNYARGYGPNVMGGRDVLPYGPVGSYWPVGGTTATLDDMAAYVRMHLRGGVSVNGRRVVSEANLAERWKPGVKLPVVEAAKPLDPDSIGAWYGLGLIHERYQDGTSLIWHNGGIDGFTTFIGFMPQHDLGLVVLNNTGPEPTGTFFYLYLLNLILSESLGLNRSAPAAITEAYRSTAEGLRKLGRDSHRADARKLASHLGYYEGGYRLVVRHGQVMILNGPRVMPLRATGGDGYVFSAGTYVGVPVTLDHDTDGVARIQIQGFDEVVRRTVSLDE
jgi:CubicO group peptidase (beta-lactamase class C family)